MFIEISHFVAWFPNQLPMVLKIRQREREREKALAAQDLVKLRRLGLQALIFRARAPRAEWFLGGGLVVGFPLKPPAKLLAVGTARVH